MKTDILNYSVGCLFLTNKGEFTMATIGVYRTDVDNVLKAKELLEMIRLDFPGCHVSFDLEDCDSVLRVESVNGTIDETKIKRILQSRGHVMENLL